MPHIIRTFLAVAALAFAAPVAAQESLFPGPRANTPATTSVVPVADSANANPSQQPNLFSLSFAASPSATAFTPAALAVQRTSDNVALMIVGGAGILIGAVVGGDEGSIIMIAGGGVGLLGLYRYLR